MVFVNKYFQKSIKRKTLLYLTIVFIIMCSSILFITQKYSKNNFYSLAENNYAYTVKSEKNLLNSYLVDRTKSMNDFIKKAEWDLERENEESFNQVNWLDDSRILEELKFFYQNNNVFYEQVFLSTENLEMYTFSDLFELELPVKINQAQFDAASNNDLSIISRGRVSKYSDKPIFTITRGLEYQGKVIAIIGGTIDLQELSKEFQKIVKEKPGETYIVRDGQYIVHDDPQMLLKDVNFDCSSFKEADGMVSISDNKIFYTETEGTLNGYLVSQISNSELYSDVDKYLLILLSMLIGLIGVSVFLIYMVAKKITAPAISLKKAMDKATEGDFFARAEKATDDELGDAANSFNILMERIRTLTFYDKLTKLPNYEQFKYWFRQETKGDNKSEKSYSFVLISINGFKKINESYGVELGDQVIIQIAGRLEKLQNRSSIPMFISRFSGDEFLLFYKNIENKVLLEEEILVILKALNSPYLIQDNSIHLRFVVGGSFCDECYRNLDFQISAVSNARSMAKKESKEYLIIGNKDNVLDSLFMLKSLENELHLALDKGHFQVYYQPLYSTDSKEYSCVEALVRYNHPEKGIISPVEFIPLAEEIDIIDKIDKFVFEQAIKDMQSLEQKGFKKLELHINVSPITMNKSYFSEGVLKTLRKHKFSPQRIWLEITEEVALLNLAEQERKIQELKKNGIRISIDDFGTGYASFLYLNQLSVDQIKIDKSFVINMKDNKSDFEIIKTITTLARSLELELVTEGVEDKESFEILNKLGANKMQGYFFAKPMDINHLEKFLAEGKK